MRAALLLLIPTLATPLAAQERQPLAPRTLDRPLSPVIVPGSRLKPLLKTPRKQLRLYALPKAGGALQPIPFQLDERTPEERYAFTRGADRRSDTDDGLLDSNDELVFMAHDAGARVARETIQLGQASLHELEVKDKAGKQAWVYVLRFKRAPPPLSKTRYVTLERRGGEVVGFSTRAVRLRADPLGGNPLAFRSLQFRTAKGWGPDVLDRLKLDLEAHYLYLTIRRGMDEVRSELTSTLEGPIRVVAGYTLEAYLVYGHWIRTTKRCRLWLYPHHLELEVEVALPVALEEGKASRLRLSLDFAPKAGALRAWSDKNPRPLSSGAKGLSQKLGRLKRDQPAWVCVSGSQGAVLARVTPSTEMRSRPWSLFLADGAEPDPPEDAAGSRANAGVSFDLTGLQRGSYALRLALVFGPTLAPAQTRRLLRLHDEPLSGTLRK